MTALWRALVMLTCGRALMMGPFWRALVAVALGLALATGASACHRSAASTRADAGPALPVVRADSDSFLLTWIDDKGDFHVETKVADVPMMGRDIVRVQGAAGELGGDGSLVIVDLRQAAPDGTFPVRTMSRADFEGLAVARRERNGPTLAQAAVSASAPAAGSATPPDRPSAHTVVIIYGAEWCGACHEAAAYLRKKGIAYVEKDIEKDPQAAREMQEKLEKHRLGGGSIPVIDVRGHVMVGFNPGEIEAALGDAL